MTGETARQGRAASGEAAQHPRNKGKRLALAIFAVLAFGAFVALGTWQVVRLQWKLALIERIEQRVHAAPVPAPGPDRWARLSAESDEYRQVRLAGTYQYEHTTRVQAVTDLGSGYWLMTPLLTTQGSIVLVNRGFIPAGKNEAGAAGQGGGHAEVTGLLRMSQPDGAFLRKNDPAAGRWYSRDVAAIAAAQGLGSVAPYFVDADAASAGRDARQAPGPAPAPVGGLTVVSFQNNHLVYALTWYALALMVAGAFYWVARHERRAGRDQEDADGSNN